ncbi:NF038122 family metalloprotease [Bradyrhizobium sp.]|jgi:hypothetical protein|uniref:NF038122 family metalloprotease n=1 Tax=Bradyrhizobium sp. TaxID=376 RepID=UPI003C3A1902
MKINVTYDSSVASAPAQFVPDVNIAVNYIQSLFPDEPASFNITIGYGESGGNSLGSSTLGLAVTYLINEPYSTVRNALIADAASGSASLPTNSPYSGTMRVSTAEDKALGLYSSSNIDGNIGFSNTLPFDYDYNQTPAAGTYYFVGVVEHEIGHVMGRICGLNNPGYYSAMDLFRYASPGVHPGQPNGSPPYAYFSTDNGATSLASIYNGSSAGSTADWDGSNIPNGGVDAFRAFTPSGVLEPFTSTDFTLMDALGWGEAPSPPPPPPPPPISADMIMRNGGNGNYQIYNIGNNSIMGTASLGQVGLEWRVAGVGAFYGIDTSDMILRNSNTGAFWDYNINNNQIVSSAPMGQVGLEWQVAGFGNFGGDFNKSDMLMRNGNTGAFWVYDINNNQIVSSNAMGQVGLEWQVAGFGNFGRTANETDMLMRNSNTGVFWVYDISNNQIVSSNAMGQVGLEWQVAGFGNFGGTANETDMLMQNRNTGAFQVYDISNNQIVSSGAMGQVGLEWQVVAFGNFFGTGADTDMLMQNRNTGAFQVYDISNNQIFGSSAMGQVGLEWQMAGAASRISAIATPDDAGTITTSEDIGTTALLAQTMATMGSGNSGIESFNPVPLGGEAPQPSSLLVPPQA